MKLGQHFTGLKDFRVEGRCLHKLSDILILVLCGVLADCSDWSEIYDYGVDKEAFLREQVGLELPNGIPSEDTLGRVMRRMKSSELEKVLQACCRDVASDLQGRQLSIDGKEIRGTVPAGKKHALVQQVSLWLEDEKLCFGQVAVAEKSNEITAIPALLEAVDCKGAIITIDAMGCQKQIAEKIVKKEADYLLALKKNQGGLYEQVSEWMEARKKQLPCFEQLARGHGRGEKRTVYVCQQLELLEDTQEWVGLRSVVLVEGLRIENGKQFTSRRYYISSLFNSTPEQLGKLVRGHWGIENGLHWHLDVTFGEDKSQIRKDSGPANFSVIRKIALMLLAKDKNPISIKRKRKKASRNQNYLLQILKNA